MVQRKRGKGWGLQNTCCMNSWRASLCQGTLGSSPHKPHITLGQPHYVCPHVRPIGVAGELATMKTIRLHYKADPPHWSNDVTCISRSSCLSSSAELCPRLLACNGVRNILRGWEYRSVWLPRDAMRRTCGRWPSFAFEPDTENGMLGLKTSLSKTRG